MHKYHSTVAVAIRMSFLPHKHAMRFKAPLAGRVRLFLVALKNFIFVCLLSIHRGLRCYLFRTTVLVVGTLLARF